MSIVLKADQRTGKRTDGVVARLLTNSSTHPHCIKVMLEDGQAGRVQEILESWMEIQCSRVALLPWYCEKELVLLTPFALEMIALLKLLAKNM